MRSASSAKALKMAILQKLEVAILVKGEQLEEYPDEEDKANDPAEITRYVEAVSGASFVIRVGLLPTFRLTSDILKFSVFLGGRYAERILHVAESAIQLYDIKGSSRQYGKQWGRRPFKFSEIISIKQQVPVSGDKVSINA